MICNEEIFDCSDFPCNEGCPKEFDSRCIDYTGTPLAELGVISGDTLEKILFLIDQNAPAQEPFIANSNNSIYAISGGILGHSPIYHVRVSSNPTNLLSSSPEGVFVPKHTGGDGKVKVEATDNRDYLENQFGTDSSAVMTVTPQKEDGKIKFVPTINVENLLNIIKSSYQSQFCEIVDDCIAGSE